MRVILTFPIVVALMSACQSAPDVNDDLVSFKETSLPADDLGQRREVLEVDWADLGSCEGQLRELLRLAARGAPLDPRSSPFGVVVGPSFEQGRPSAPPVGIEPDLPIPVGAAAAAHAPCLLKIGAAQDFEARRRIVGQEAVASEYQSGLRREDNPAYEIARAKVEMAKRQASYDDEVWVGVGDPMVDVVGLLVGSIVEGFREGASESAVSEAMLELAKTPKKIDRPVYATYRFERVIVDTARRATFPVQLVDRRRGTSAQATVRHTEQRRFHVPQGLSKRDRNYAQHHADSISRERLNEWLKSPPELPLSRIVLALLGEARPDDSSTTAAGMPIDDMDAWESGALADQTRGAWPMASSMAHARSARSYEMPRRIPEPLAPTHDDPDLIRFDDVTEQAPLRTEFGRAFDSSGRSELVERSAVPHAAAAAALVGDDGWQDPFRPRRSRPRDRQAADLSGDPRFASVVMIRAGPVLGSGFYVRPDLVVTNYHVVGGANLVDLVDVDGTRVMGIVVATDAGRDLALVHTPAPGRPAPLHGGPELRPGDTVDAIGAPHGYDFTLTRGIVSAVRTRPALLAPAMQQVRYVQTDAAINRGNSGGPLFLGSEVVGVNDRVDPDAVSGGLNFAIHVDELRAFLAEEGVTLHDGHAPTPPGNG